MKNRQISPTRMFIGILILLLSLSACVRPVPTDGTPAPTQSLADAQTQVPLATNTPIPDASTPDSAATVDPAATPVVDPTGEGGTPEATVVAPATSTPTTTTPTNPGTYVVQPGDTVYSISVRYGVSVDAIAAANNLDPHYTIYVGQTLVIPGGDGSVPTPSPVTPVPGGCSQTHVVQPGENLFRIGLNYGYTVNQLAAANPDIVNPNNIKVGQVICIP